MASKTKTIKTDPFTLSTPAGRDIWRKPPAHDVFDAPFYPNPLPTYPLKAFQKARISFELPAVDKLRKFDQAGLLLVLHREGEGAMEYKASWKWLKTGIEFYEGKPYISTVCTDRWSDWSIVPLPSPPSHSSTSSSSASSSASPSATIEVERDGGIKGKTLWVYHVVKIDKGEEVERRPLREIAWFFAEEEGWEIGIGGAVARPTTEGGEGKLQGSFSELSVEVLDV